MKRLTDEGYELVEKKLTIGTNAYQTLFRDAHLEPYRQGALYVTTNGVVIWDAGSTVLWEKEMKPK